MADRAARISWFSSSAILLAICALPDCALRAAGPVARPTSLPVAAENLPSNPDWEQVLADLRDRKLPTDIPLPRQTPYDGDLKQRMHYLDGYSFGFADGLQFSHSCLIANEARWQGYRAGQSAGFDLYQKRSDAEGDRKFRFDTGALLTERSPAPDVQVWKSFEQFRLQLIAAVKRDFPATLRMSKDDYSTVYRYPYRDYSGSNTGACETRQGFKGLFSFTLSVAPDAAEDAETTALKGQYMMQFEFGNKHWAWEDEPWFLMQQEGKRNQEMEGWLASYTGSDSTLPAERIRAAVKAAGGVATTAPSR